MPFMPGLTIIVATSDPARFEAALELAAANAALDRRTRLFLQRDAVPLLRPEPPGSALALLSEALALGASTSVCQSGLALSGMTADQLPPGVETGGLVELLASQGDDQLLLT